MCEPSIHPHAVMEGGGAYNKYAKPQAQGIGSALPLFEQMLRDTAIDDSDRPVVIADYGSSQGKNSLAPMRLAIQTVRARLDPRRPVVIYHVDQASNDFNALFRALDSDPDRYTVDEHNVFSCAIGRSFYASVLPPETVDIGWSSYAVVWLSRIPTPIPGHFHSARSTGAVRAEFDRQGVQDWESFLSLRAKELRPGGHLMVVLPSVANGGELPGFLDLLDQASIVLAEMVAQGAITSDERARMVLGSYARTRRELLAPFAAQGTFRQLIVEHCETLVPVDTAWVNYQHDGDQEILATTYTQFFRSTFMPSLASALAGSSDAGVVREFGNRLEAGLRQRMTNRPAPLGLLVEVIVVAKQS
jgi:SAM dependent carboxyl methyltransferase